MKQTSTQEDIFKASNMTNFLKKSIDGFNCTVFAYGQTGSGKTYTMEGKELYNKQVKASIDNEEKQNDFGLIPRSIQKLFELIQQQPSNKVFKVYFSFLQIYQEKIFDLLAPQQDGMQQLRVRWSKENQFSVENLYVIEIGKFQEGFELFKRGLKNKIIASHNLNMQSSRSHCILTLKVEQYSKDDPENIISSKIQLVDLAGSERSSHTGVEGKHQKEAIEINKSLFTLRSVIQQIYEQQQNYQHPRKEFHVSYRDSKLTQLLKSSIGGQTYCKMIACIAPLDRYIDENIQTLNYASITQSISNEPIINEDPKLKKIRDLKQKIRELTKQLKFANDHIVFLSQLTDQQIKQFGMPHDSVLASIEKDSKFQSLDQDDNSPKQQKSIDKIDFISNPENEEYQYNEDAINNNLAQLDNILAKTYHNNKTQSNSLVKGLGESVNMIKDLLRCNTNLREQISEMMLTNEKLEKESQIVNLENQDIRERMELVESLMEQTIIQDSENEKAQNAFSCQKALNMIVEIQKLRKTCKFQKEKIGYIEQENYKYQRQLYPGQPLKKISSSVFNDQNMNFQTINVGNGQQFNSQQMSNRRITSPMSTKNKTFQQQNSNSTNSNSHINNKTYIITPTQKQRKHRVSQSQSREYLQNQIAIDEEEVTMRPNDHFNDISIISPIQRNQKNKKKNISQKQLENGQQLNNNNNFNSTNIRIRTYTNYETSHSTSKNNTQQNFSINNNKERNNSSGPNNLKKSALKKPPYIGSGQKKQRNKTQNFYDKLHQDQYRSLYTQSAGMQNQDQLQQQDQLQDVQVNAFI